MGNKFTTMKTARERAQVKAAMAGSLPWQQTAQGVLGEVSGALGLVLTAGCYKPETNEYMSVVVAGRAGVTAAVAADYLEKVGKQMLADAERLRASAAAASPAPGGGVSKPEKFEDPEISVPVGDRIEREFCEAVNPTPSTDPHAELRCAEPPGHEGEHQFARGVPR